MGTEPKKILLINERADGNSSIYFVCYTRFKYEYRFVKKFFLLIKRKVKKSHVSINTKLFFSKAR